MSLLDIVIVAIVLCVLYQYFLEKDMNPSRLDRFNAFIFSITSLPLLIASYYYPFRMMPYFAWPMKIIIFVLANVIYLLVGFIVMRLCEKIYLCIFRSENPYKITPNRQQPTHTPIHTPPPSFGTWDSEDVTRLKELKCILGMTNNAELDPFVREFMDDVKANYQYITPDNVKQFNIFLIKNAFKGWGDSIER